MSQYKFVVFSQISQSCMTKIKFPSAWKKTMTLTYSTGKVQSTMYAPLIYEYMYTDLNRHSKHTYALLY